MAYCSKCGQMLRDGAKFCDNCGTPVDVANDSSKRKVVFEGKVYKCPNCGEILDAFMVNCPSCGYEIRGAEAADSVKSFAVQLANARSEAEIVSIIRHFPIPNTKEDIWEFMILASSNVNQDLDGEISSAWQAKLEQVMQKSRLVLHEKSDLSEIEKQYQGILKKLGRKRSIQSAKKMGSSFAEIIPALPRLIIVFGWLLSLFVLLPMCRVDLDNVGTNGFQLLMMIDLIAGAVIIPIVLNCELILPKLTAITGLVLHFVVLLPLCRENLDDVGFNAFQLIMFIEVICSIVILVRTIKNRRKPTEVGSGLNGAALIVTVICLVTLFVVYTVGRLTTHDTIPNIDTKSPVISGDEKTNVDQGIYTYPIRNYIGKNAASVGKMRGESLVEEYGSGYVRIVFVTEDGMILVGDDNLKKGYIIVGQSIAAGSPITVVHKRDSKGRPYSYSVDFQSYEELILYAAPVGNTTYHPKAIDLNPTLDRHCFFIRDYSGRNAASFGRYYGDTRVDEYGAGKLRITFTCEDGSFVDASTEDSLKGYMVISQDIEVNTELKIDYTTDSKGNEFDYSIRSQNLEEINLTVRKIDKSIVSQMPKLAKPKK